ncbi:hypothetical protein BT69DRAFT_1284156, partial [Atractiella rhizophila]
MDRGFVEGTKRDSRFRMTVPPPTIASSSLVIPSAICITIPNPVTQPLVPPPPSHARPLS